MSNYKLIASDLDGTLLRGDMTISPENSAAIRKFTEYGVTFVATSGRTLYEIPEEVRENPSIRYLTYSNGTAVYDKEIGKDIISNRISKECISQVFNAISGYEVMLSVHSNGHAYFESGKNNDEAFSYYQVNDYYKKLLTKDIMVCGLDEFCRNSSGIEAIVMFFHSDSELEECRTKLEAVEGLTVTSSIGHNIELCSDKAGKGEALATLAELLGISGEDIISVGDNMNDISMFSVSGLALCVESGSEEAKALADEVICTNEENVLDYILTHYIDPPAEEKPKLNKKTLAAIIGACAAALVMFIAIIAISISSSAVKVGYAGIKNSESWSGTYVKLDGQMSHILRTKNDEIRISVVTESGKISIEILDSEGNVIFNEDNIGTQEFWVDVDGKAVIRITAYDHKGKFVIG